MKKFFLALLLFFIAVQLHSQVIRERISDRRNSKPVTLDEGMAPQYADLFYWAAHPGKKDNSDTIPSFITDKKTDTLADVFFLHPTTYTKNMEQARSNADLHDSLINAETDKGTILFQASVFNVVGRVFAPRYRQAHLKAYLSMESDASQKAFDLAYRDIKAAFEYYLAHNNNGKPIVIASHSQGAMHAIRLLQEFFDNKPLQKKLVCAYIVGWQIKEGDLKKIPVGTTASATNCFVGWRSFKHGSDGGYMIARERGNSICVNPITWTTDETTSTLAQHKGGVARDLNKLYPKTITTLINKETGILWVTLPQAVAAVFESVNNYHILDYNLYYLDIRENVQLRVRSFVEKK
ncbi:MAG TPA: DUF3089 domain-containing protein [Chitinophagaceae bacterium]|jgi:hypothetical protein|nr:DUF3089 domain-containing protein [Chitinophagaceae bacterium]